MEDNPLNIIILGRSGSGKGTQAKLLVEELNLEYIATGDLLRAFAERGNIAGLKLKETLTHGKLVPSWFAFFIWMEKLAYTNMHKGVLFDGSPRKIAEAEMLDDVLAWFGRTNMKVVLIDISREEAHHRLSNRMVCPSCGKGAYKKNDGNTRCRYCQAELIARPDDDPMAIESRLDWFENEVIRVIEYYRAKGCLITVSGEQSPEDAHREIMGKLGLAA
ncbi:MAG: nucleoside monophosphate kinase [Patescibacteria group bacterium]